AAAAWPAVRAAAVHAVHDFQAVSLVRALDGTAGDGVTGSVAREGVRQFDDRIDADLKAAERALNAGPLTQPPDLGPHFQFRQLDAPDAANDLGVLVYDTAAANPSYRIALDDGAGVPSLDAGRSGPLAGSADVRVDRWHAHFEIALRGGSLAASLNPATSVVELTGVHARGTLDGHAGLRELSAVDLHGTVSIDGLDGVLFRDNAAHAIDLAALRDR